MKEVFLEHGVDSDEDTAISEISNSPSADSQKTVEILGHMAVTQLLECAVQGRLPLVSELISGQWPFFR